jgi:hypothetical protein
MINKIKHCCETCKVRLNKGNFKKHFNLNHMIHTNGQFIIKANKDEIDIAPWTIFGIALEDVKAGNIGKFILKNGK